MQMSAKIGEYSFQSYIMCNKYFRRTLLFRPRPDRLCFSCETISLSWYVFQQPPMRPWRMELKKI